MFFKNLRKELFIIIFGTDTKAGKLFDVVLLWAIILSVLVVILESTPVLHEKYFMLFYYAEWVFTVFFSIEYAARIWAVKKPIRYIFSFWGIIDFLSITPTYISLFITGTQYLLVIRTLRLLRVFRVLKLGRYLNEAQLIILALRNSFHKIIVFLGTVLVIVLISGTLMYVVESGQNGFHSIPQAIYWAIVTITTVGFGDVVPTTTLGKIISSIMMIIGYSIIAVPTGILTVELGKSMSESPGHVCYSCGHIEKEIDSNFCKKCGEKFPIKTSDNHG